MPMILVWILLWIIGGGFDVYRNNCIDLEYSGREKNR